MQDTKNEALQDIFKKNTLSIIRNYLSNNEKLNASLLSKKIHSYLKEALNVNVHVEEKEGENIENLEQKLEEIHLTKIIESFTIDTHSRKYDFLSKTPSITALTIFIHKGQEDINCLSDLTHLKKLIINGEVEGEIENLITLSLTKKNNCIEELTLNHCDIKSVDSFIGLKKLVLNRSTIKEPKSKFSNIKKLEYISDDETIPIILQAESTKLFGYFDSLEELRLANIYSKEYLNFLGNFTKLKKLDLFFADNYSVGIDFLRDKTTLSELHLNNMKTNSGGYHNESIEKKIENFTNLEKLSLINMNLKNLNFLSFLPKLKELRIGGNNAIDKFNNIGQITNLELLDISDCDVKNIDFFGFLISLKKLNMSGNKSIKKLNPISNLAKLEELDISNCNLDLINFFQELQSIKKLNLSNNSSIKNYDPLRALNDLESLDIRNCGLTSIDTIKDLHHLIYVDLRGNKIDNIGLFYNQDRITIKK